MNNIKLINLNNLKVEVEESLLYQFDVNASDIQDMFEVVGYELENRDLEDVEVDEDYIMEVVYDNADNFACDSLSIYNDDVVEALHELKHWRIDEIIDNSGWIEYSGSYSEFARCIVAEDLKERLLEAIINILRHVNIYRYSREDFETVKADIIYHLENYRDLDLDRLCQEVVEDIDNNYCPFCKIQFINEYISTINYCSYQAVGFGKNRREWGAYNHFYIDLYRDEDIKKAIVEYVSGVKESDAKAEKMEAENLEKITEISESGEDADHIESLIKYIDDFYNKDDRFKKVYQQLHLRLEYLHTIKYIKDVLESDEENKVEQFIETMKAMKNPQSIKLLSEAITKLLS